MYSLSDIAGILRRDRVSLLGWARAFALPEFFRAELSGYRELLAPIQLKLDEQAPILFAPARWAKEVGRDGR
ncbi:hypothetical protein [Luteolibacter marinus]|uniref:hypothetical protein n=1 Tax=Luteolibacter marinus TaxID=2776705 RepID=UPI0018661928|nr:hypothetical protein [Luteolibacter marinus]